MKFATLVENGSDMYPVKRVVVNVDERFDLRRYEFRLCCDIVKYG